MIVGYSIPEEDARIRLLLRQFAEDNVDGTEKVIFFVELMDSQTQITKLENIFPIIKELEKRVLGLFCQRNGTKRATDRRNANVLRMV